MIDAPQLVALIGRHRLPLHDEKATQGALESLLLERNIAFEREKRLGAGDRVDFFVAPDSSGGGIAVELKLRAPRRGIYKQLKRYAGYPAVRALVLVTATAMGLPPEIQGKPSYYVSLGRAWM